MQQYFIHTSTQVGDVIQLNEEQAHHISHVMRMKHNACIRIADVQAHVFLALIVFQKGKVYAHITEQIEDTTKNCVDITLAQGLIKGDKWDYLLQKSAELGVCRILPFMSSRCVVKHKEEKADKKLARWNKILLEACEQCKRSTLVEMREPMKLAALYEQTADVKLIAYEDADTTSERLCDVLQSYPNVHKVLVVVGSEGGFSSTEVKELCAHGFVKVSLGTRILRAETAALALLNSIAFYYDMKGGEE